MKIWSELPGELQAVLPGVKVVGVPTFVTDIRGRIVAANSALLKMLGAEVDELLGRNVTDFVAEVEKSSSKARQFAMRAERETPGLAWDPVVRQIVHRDGRCLLVRATPQPVYEDGQVVGVVVTVSDVTAEHDAREAWAEVEARYATLAFMAPVGIMETDGYGRCQHANVRWCEMLGRPLEEIVGVNWMKMIHPDDAAELAEIFANAHSRNGAFRHEFRIVRPDGGVIPVHGEAVPLRDSEGSITGWIGCTMDLSDQLALREALGESEQRFRHLAERSVDVVFKISIRPTFFEYVNPAIETLTGYTPEEVYTLGQAGGPEFLIHPDDRLAVSELFSSDNPPETLTVRVQHRDGSVRPVEIRATIVRNEHGAVTAIEGIARDVSVQEELHQHLDHLAHQDPVTGLYNRRAALLELDRRGEQGVASAVLFCDLDGFKQVNDEYGHEAGDDVLIELSKRLVSTVRDGDMVARFAGDEFVVVIAPEHAEVVSGRILAALCEPIQRDAGAISVGVSIGVAVMSGEDTSASIVRRADEAMYLAKRRGKAQIVKV